MAWLVEVTDEFAGWWDALGEDQQNAVAAGVSILEQAGPALGRPLVDRIADSRVHNLKDLRISVAGHELRILFVFDPRRVAVLLLGGDKTGHWDAWYATAIPAAERLYDQLLAELRGEGLLDDSG
jgi:hypothetical protein